MTKPLRVIVFEDSERDFELLVRSLKREGYDVVARRAETLEEAREILGEGRWDIAISDYNMPRMNVSDALALVHDADADMPLIVISGSVGEEMAVSAMKAGAHDFFLKDRLSRLSSAIDREIREADVRRQRRETMARLAESEVQLRQAVRARDEFLSIASHELKTPLTPLVLDLATALELVRRRRAGGDPPNLDKLEARLDKCVRHVERITALVNNLLDVTRITSGKLRITPRRVDLRELVVGVLDRHARAIDRSRSAVRLAPGEPIVGTWDPEGLEAVTTNLLLNALKYGESKPIEIDLGVADGVARLSVRDHGMGIAPEEQRRIFQRFERAVPSAHYGGFGLGLWVARQVVEAHGGAIEVTSAKGEGSTFTVRLPVLTEPSVS